MRTTYATQYHLLAQTSVESAAKRRFIDGVQNKSVRAENLEKFEKNIFVFSIDYIIEEHIYTPNLSVFCHFASFVMLFLTLSSGSY